MTIEPARLEPRFVPRIWGATSLAPLYPEKTKLSEPIGEVWLTGDDSTFASGPWEGRRLGDAWHEMPAQWAGTRMNTREAFPLLVKFLFPRQKLSIQVHPTDDYARKHESAAGGRGKTEMWHVIAAEPGAEVMVGLKPGTTPESFRRAISEGTAENCLEHIPLAADDSVFVPAGTVHTIGPGQVLCEIQENSDITYRVFDYNRPGLDGKPRPLYVEQALAVSNFGETLGGKLEPVRTKARGLSEAFLAACRHFSTERWEFDVRIGGVTSLERFELLIFLAGSGRIEVPGAHAGADYAPAQVWLLPAGLGAYNLAPQGRTTLLRTYVPDLGDVGRRLRGRGVSEVAVARLVYA